MYIIKEGHSYIVPQNVITRLDETEWIATNSAHPGGVRCISSACFVSLAILWILKEVCCQIITGI